MEATGETKKAPSQKKIIIAIVILILVIIGAAVAVVSALNKEEDNQKIKYATEATVFLDEDSLQAAMDEAMRNARDGNVALLYKDNAYSTDGQNFECYIANSSSNAYDMFLTIFADPELTDQVFLSGLVPPGSGFEHIKLDRALETGDHTVYVALTQVKDDEETGEQMVHNQVMHTMEFHVEA